MLPVKKKKKKKRSANSLPNIPCTEYNELCIKAYFASNGQFPVLTNFFEVILCDRTQHLFLKLQLKSHIWALQLIFRVNAKWEFNSSDFMQ